MSERAMALAAAAESFVGTPFRFRGRDPRTGLDCVGLIAAALTKLGEPAAPLPAYSLRQSSFSRLFGHVAKAGFAEARDAPASGDLLLVRPGPAQVHLSLVGTTGGFVHAHAGLGRVVVTPSPLPWPIERHWRLRNS